MKKKVSLHNRDTELGLELIALSGATHGGVGEREDIDAVIDLVSISSLYELAFPIDVAR